MKNSDVPHKVRAKKEFKLRTMSGVVCTGPYMPYTGMLPQEWVDKLADDMSKSAQTYVLYSYNTPIGWTDSFGAWFVPAVKYSATASRHQSLARKV